MRETVYFRRIYLLYIFRNTTFILSWPWDAQVNQVCFVNEGPDRSYDSSFVNTQADLGLYTHPLSKGISTYSVMICHKVNFNYFPPISNFNP